mmetsp:Transcript_76106/g.219834  ORF Transcript_76106/g.219834 Transcript_76106/m.219834 type:complete len:355 (-) Transcript_76106:362-1426(-)
MSPTAAAASVPFTVQQEEAAASQPPLEARIAAIFGRGATPEDEGRAPTDAERAAAPKGVFPRERVPEGQLVAVGRWGIEGFSSFQTSKRWGKFGFQDRDRGDRAISAQTSANLESLFRAGLRLEEPLLPDMAQPGTFGENLFLDSSAMDPRSVCIGDEFTLFRCGKEHCLRLQVASPRRPCGKVDQKFGKTTTLKGVRAHCSGTGLTGLFFRVLQRGDVRAGDVLRLTARPHPSWNLERASQLLYGHPEAIMKGPARGLKAYADRVTSVVTREEWMGSQEELLDFASLPELAVCEWKEHAFKMLGREGIGRYRRGHTDNHSPTLRTTALLILASAAAAMTMIGIARRAAGSRAE